MVRSGSKPYRKTKWQWWVISNVMHFLSQINWWAFLSPFLSLFLLFLRHKGVPCMSEGGKGKHNFNIFVLQLFSWIKSVLVCSWQYLLWKKHLSLENYMSQNVLFQIGHFRIAPLPSTQLPSVFSILHWYLKKTLVRITLI